jgi:hypothetical protein
MTMLVVRHGAAGDPDDVTPDRGWDVDAFDDALEYPESYNRAGGTGTDPELFYEGRPDELHLNSVGIFVLNLGDHPEHLEQSEELCRGFHIITPFDGPDCDEQRQGSPARAPFQAKARSMVRKPTLLRARRASEGEPPAGHVA